MPISNFLRAYAEVEIRDTADGRWFFNAPENPFLTGVTIVLGCMDNGFGIPSITLNFDMPYLEGIALLESGCFRTQNRVAVRLGYVGDTSSPTWWGSLSQAGDGLSLTPEGLSGSVTVTSLADTAWSDFSAVEVKGQSAFIMYAQVAKYLGCKLYFSPNAKDRIKFVQGGDPDSHEKFAWPAVPTGRNAWEWLLWLNGATGVSATIAFSMKGERTLYVLTKAESEQGAIQDAEGTPEFFKLRTYRMRGRVSPQTDEYPILSWGPDPGLAQWDGILPAGTSGMATAVTTSMYTGEPVSASAPSTEQEVPVVQGVEHLPTLEFQQAEFDLMAEQYELTKDLNPERLPIPSPPPPDAATVAAQAKEVAKDAQVQGNAAQKATIATVGVPMEFPGNRCKVAGCSTRYDDIYKIWTVTHNYAGGVWDMTLAVQREGGRAQKLDDAVLPAGGENKE